MIDKKRILYSESVKWNFGFRCSKSLLVLHIAGSLKSSKSLDGRRSSRILKIRWPPKLVQSTRFRAFRTSKTPETVLNAQASETTAGISWVKVWQRVPIQGGELCSQQLIWLSTFHFIAASTIATECFITFGSFVVVMFTIVAAIAAHQLKRINLLKRLLAAVTQTSTNT